MDKKDEISRATAALRFIVPILEKYNFRWVITGGFACYVYGVERLLTDIDVDIDVSKDAKEFKNFLSELEPFITQPLEHYVSPSYDNYNFEVTYMNQIIDICPMNELLLFNTKSQTYDSFYKGKFPDTEMVDFHGFNLPLLSKSSIIDNKQSLTDKNEWHQRDIDGLKSLLGY